MTQTSTGPGMDLMDADYAAPTEPREGVSAAQQALIVGDADLTDTEKSKALDTLSTVATGDYFWPLVDLDEEMATLYGLARDSDGLWRAQ